MRRPTGRGRLAGIITVAAALLVVTSAGGAPVNGYTASSQPAVVKPATVFTYTIRLTNNADSPERGQRARIGIPPGFSVSSLGATSSATGTCTASAWTATAVVDGVVEFKKPGGGPANELCPGATLTISIGTAAPTEGTWTWTTELLRDDKPFALQGSQPSLRVDGTAPVVTIDESPADPSNDATPSFGFVADEGGVAFECRLDDGAFAPCVSPKSYGPLPDGTHTFRVRGTDQAGNVSATVTRSWTIATIAPLTTIQSGPASQSNSTSAVFTFSTPAAGASYACKLDDGAFEACTSPKAYAGLADGPHAFHVQATDAAGNQGSPAGYSWTVDTAPPHATIDAKPASLGRATTAAFEFSADEGGTTFECKLDGSGFSACTSPTSYGPLADGTHSFSVRATDRAGNVGSAETYSWRVDTTPPGTTITAAPPAVAASTSASFSFASTEAGSTFECRLDTLAWVGCVSPTPYTGLAQGAHTFSVRATDAAGNVDGSPATSSWTVDTVAPDTTIVAKPASLTNSSSAAFTFSSSEAGTFECKLDGEPGFTACGASKTYSSLGDGGHTLTVRARDDAGNVDGTPASYTWTVDTVAPDTIIGSGPPNPSTTGAASFSFTSTEPGSTFECRIDGASFAPCSSPASYSLPDGQRTFRVRAVDAAGNVDSSPATRTWLIDTQEPDTEITTNPPAAANAGSATFEFRSSDSGVGFECRLGSESFATCSSPKTYSSLADRSYRFEVRARDDSGNVDLTPAFYEWTVDTVAPDTTIGAGPPNTSASPIASFAFGSNEPGTTFECKLDSGSFGTCTSPVSYSLPDGQHTFQVRAKDRATNVDPSPASRTWTVDTTPPQTTITSAPPDPSRVGTASFTFTSDENTAAFECKLDGGPFGTCTSPASYSLPDGQHTFQVRAVDRAANVDPTPAAHTWTIDTVAPTPTIALPVDGSSTNDTTPPFSGTAGTAATDSPLVTLRIHAGPTVAGPVLQAFSVVRTGGSWAGAAGPLAEGIYTARAEQTDAALNTGFSQPTTFTVDTGGPGTAITSRPPNPAVGTTATFAFASSDPVATFRCRLDAGEFVVCASPVTYEGLAAGVHVFTVNATDRAGNTGGNASYSWTIIAPVAPPPTPPATPPTPPGPAADLVPPHDVTNVRAKAANGTVTLTWAPPADPDFDRVSITRTAAGKNARAATIYRGVANRLTDRRLKNGVRYRYKITTHDRAGNTSAGVQVTAMPLAPLFAPLNGARVTAPPVLRWRTVPRATYYNVQLWLVRASGRQLAARRGKVLSAWPSAPRLTLSARWTYDGVSHRLVPGKYRWYVFPGFGKRSQARYGALLGQSAFTVTAKSVAKTTK